MRGKSGVSMNAGNNIVCNLVHIDRGFAVNLHIDVRVTEVDPWRVGASTVVAIGREDMIKDQLDLG